MKRLRFELKKASESGQKQKDVLLPAVWLRTPKAINNLTATGLSSLLPGCDLNEEGNNTLGRKYFAQQLWKIAENSEELKTMIDEDRRNLQNEIMKESTALDLKGE